MRSEGFSFNSGGLEVGVVSAQRCLHDRKRSQPFSQPFAGCRNEVAKPHHGAALTECDQDDVLQVDFLANSVLLLGFVTCGCACAILWKCVNVSVSFARGRCSPLHSPLCWCILQFRGRPITHDVAKLL